MIWLDQYTGNGPSGPATATPPPPPANWLDPYLAAQPDATAAPHAQDPALPASSIRALAPGRDDAEIAALNLDPATRDQNLRDLKLAKLVAGMAAPLFAPEEEGAEAALDHLPSLAQAAPEMEQAAPQVPGWPSDGFVADHSVPRPAGWWGEPEPLHKSVGLMH